MEQQLAEVRKQKALLMERETIANEFVSHIDPLPFEDILHPMLLKAMKGKVRLLGYIACTVALISFIRYR